MPSNEWMNKHTVLHAYNRTGLKTIKKNELIHNYMDEMRNKYARVKEAAQRLHYSTDIKF